MNASASSSREIDCIVCGTCVADILVRPVPLSVPVGGGRLFHVDPIEATTGGIVCNTGIAMRRLGMRVAAASLVGRKVVVVANLAPRKMRFGVSEGMVLCASGSDDRVYLLSPDDGAAGGMAIN